MTDERLEKLRAINGENGYDDVTWDKQKILKDLYKDSDLFEVLNNTDLKKQDAVPEDYYNVNIFSFLKIPDAQSTVRNFVCFEVNKKEEIQRNEAKILKYVVFRTVSHGNDVETEYGINRQDLLALIIKDRFQWSNVLGLQLKLIYDTGKISEDGYYYRDMYFKQSSLSGLQRGVRQNMLDKNRQKYDIE